MRRRRWSVVVGALAALAVASCTGGGDPKPGSAAPASPAPACHREDYTGTAADATDGLVDCAGPHRTETVHTGTLTAAASNAPAPPARGAAEIRTAYTRCDTAAAGYLGGQWRHARLWLGVVLPTGQAWIGGARWFRCDLAEVAGADDPARVARTGSLAGALRDAASPLLLSCFTAKLVDGDVAPMTAAACTAGHNAEFGGVWTAPDGPPPTTSAQLVKLHDGCRTLNAGYAGLPVDDLLPYRLGVIARPAAAGEWRDGNRGVRCYLWTGERAVTRSLKGAGPSAFPTGNQ